jgi:hypothetical protein
MSRSIWKWNKDKFCIIGEKHMSEQSRPPGTAIEDLEELPDPLSAIRLYKSRWIALTSRLFSALFVVAPPLLIHLKGEVPWPIWLSTGFFSFCLLGALHTLLDRRPQIILDVTGVWDRTLRQERIPWEMVLDAYPINIAGQKFIALTLDDTFVVKGKFYGGISRLNYILGAQRLNLNLVSIQVNVNALHAAILLLIRSSRDERATLLAALANGNALRK